MVTKNEEREEMSGSTEDRGEILLRNSIIVAISVTIKLKEFFS